MGRCGCLCELAMNLEAQVPPTRALPGAWLCHTAPCATHPTGQSQGLGVYICSCFLGNIKQDIYLFPTRRPQLPEASDPGALSLLWWINTEHTT